MKRKKHVGCANVIGYQQLLGVYVLMKKTNWVIIAIPTSIIIAILSLLGIEI